MDLDKEEKNKNDISTSISTLQKEIADAEHMNKVLENLSVGFGAPPLPVLQERKDVLRTYKDSLIQSVEYIKQKYKKYQTAKSELKHLVAKYDNALKLNNSIKTGLLELEKKENDKILRQKRYIDDDIKQKYNMHQRTKSKKSGIKKFTPTNEKNTLYDIFGNIRTQIEILKYTDQFDDGYSHREILLPNLEIVLTLEQTYNYDKSFIIKFRRYDKIEPCIKILMTLKDMRNAIINNVDIEKCEQNDNNITVRHCYIILVILLCSFLEISTIQLRDCNCYNEKKQGYRNSQFNSNNNPERPAYSHHFSYFAPYNFEDVLYNKEKYVLARNKENDNMSLINGMSNYYPIEQQSYILMTRKSLRNDENFTNYLKKIVLKDVKSMDALAKILKENTSNNLEEEDLYKLLDNNTSSSKTVPPPASFGSYSTYSLHV
jgi:hypothetical protein